jgi:hypothetical protein
VRSGAAVQHHAHQHTTYTRIQATLCTEANTKTLLLSRQMHTNFLLKNTQTVASLLRKQTLLLSKPFHIDLGNPCRTLSHLGNSRRTLLLSIHSHIDLERFSQDNLSPRHLAILAGQILSAADSWRASHVGERYPDHVTVKTRRRGRWSVMVRHNQTSNWHTVMTRGGASTNSRTALNDASS